ncbi:hypothetical protein [Nostoc sp.]|uniref:hypothetical protein n=1 Tax=Nostoc sp. TaxID=1180 RepID=UPI002FFA8878
MKQVVRAYRDEYLTERGFARLKGFPLFLTPIYLQRGDHIAVPIQMRYKIISLGVRAQQCCAPTGVPY